MQFDIVSAQFKLVCCANTTCIEKTYVNSQSQTSIHYVHIILVSCLAHSAVHECGYWKAEYSHLCFSVDCSHLSWKINELESMFIFKLGRCIGVFA
jgi:hypothetical protein